MVDLSKESLSTRTGKAEEETFTAKTGEITATSNEMPKVNGPSAAEEKNNKKETKKFGLHRDDIIPQFRVPFIMSGYREPNLEAVECLHSAFIPTCNETVNFWSHFIAFAVFVLKFYNLYTNEYSIYDRPSWPMLSSAIGICGFCLASSIAHLFNSMSPAAMRRCFFVDYAAISIYTVGMGQACFMYSRPLKSQLFIFQTEWIFTALSVLTAMIATTLCCITTFRWQRYKYVIRTVAFAAPFVVNSGPAMYRLFARSTDTDTDAISPIVLRAFTIHVTLYVASAIVNMSRFPERLFPGAFDVFGHSHHFLHIFTGIGACYQFDAFHLDWIARKDALTNQPIKASFCNTLLPFLISIVINFGIAYSFGKKCGKKAEHKKE